MWKQGWQKIRSDRLFTFVLLFPVLLVLFAYVFYPSLRTFLLSIGISDISLRGVEGFLSIETYKSFILEPTSLEALWNSIYISLLSVLFAALVGVPLAFIFTRYDFPGRSFFSSIAVMPIVLPSLVGVLAFYLLYGETGLVTRMIQDLLSLQEPPFRIGGVPGILLVHTYTEYVYFYVTVSAAIRNLNPSLEEAATNLGAKPITVFWKVTLPMLTPALIASSLLVFMTSMASFSAPFILGNGIRVLSVEIYNSKMNNALEMAAVQSVVLSIISIGFLLFMRWYQGRRDYRMSEKGISAQRKEIRNPFLKWTLVGLAIVGVIILLLPHFTLFLLSFVPDGTWTVQPYPPEYSLINYQQLLVEPSVWEPVQNSLWMATIATIGNFFFGVLASYVLVKRRFRGKSLVDILVMLPWSLPATVVAINLIFAFNQPSIFTFQTVLVGTFWILPLAYFVRHIPLVVRSTNAALEQLDDSLEEAARNLGATWFYTFRKVVLPIILPGIMAGALLAFVTSVGEYVSSVLLFTYENRPISIEIDSYLRKFNVGQASAYAVYQIVLIGIVMFISEKFFGVKAENSL